MPCHISSCRRPLLNYHRLPAGFPPPGFPRCPRISPGPRRGHEDVSACSDSWFLSLLERLLFQTGNYSVLHSVFCSTLPLWAGLEFVAGVEPWQAGDGHTSRHGIFQEHHWPAHPQAALLCQFTNSSLQGSLSSCFPMRMAQDVALGWAGLRREGSLTLHLDMTQILRESRGGRV